MQPNLGWSQSEFIAKMETEKKTTAGTGKRHFANIIPDYAKHTSEVHLSQLNFIHEVSRPYP